ncbi:MAG: hypothetical protein R2758_08785 [Bacteroidales bacterium]
MYPDGCFVEDTAVVNSRVKVISRPGAATRRGRGGGCCTDSAGSGPVESITAPEPWKVEMYFGLRIIISSAYPKGQMRRGPASFQRSLPDTIYIICCSGGGRTAPETDIAYLGDGNFISNSVFSNVAPPANTIILDP